MVLLAALSRKDIFLTRSHRPRMNRDTTKRQLNDQVLLISHTAAHPPSTTNHTDTKERPDGS